jgi:hypothetical protein
VLGRRRVQAIRTLVAGVTVAATLLVPGASAAIFRTEIHEEQTRIQPLVEQWLRDVSRYLDQRPSMHPRAPQQPHR